jgi:predicted Zn-dependent peptidase
MQEFWDFAKKGLENFDFNELCDLANKYCGHWTNSSVSRDKPEFKLPKNLPVTKTLTKKDLNRSHVMILTPGPEIGSKYEYDADVLTTILGDSSGSKTFWALIDSGLADSASIETEQMDSVGSVYGYASTEPDKLEEVTEILSNVMKSAKDFTDDDLMRAITKTSTRLVLQGESTMRRMMACGFDWSYQGIYRTLEEELDKTKKVSRESIYKMLEEFSLEPSHKVSLLPE